MLEFLKRKQPTQAMELPALLQPENPVNYDSVLDWLLGLSKPDYDKMIKVVENYREAKKTEAKILKVKDEATTQLLSHKLTDDEIDDGLDLLIETDPKVLKASLEAESKQIQENSASNKTLTKKIEVQD
jgi:hypothetical protein